MTCHVMPMTAAHGGRSGHPGFRSFKTPLPIRYPARWHRDLLIQATLDPAVETIEDGSGHHTDAMALVLTVQGLGRRVLAVRDGSCLPPSTGIEGIVVTRSYVLSEPRCSNARMVWSMRNSLVSPGNQLRVLAKLREHPGWMAIGRVSESLSVANADPIEVILALACAGRIEIDLGRGFSPDTQVRHRSALELTPPISTGIATVPS